MRSTQSNEAVEGEQRRSAIGRMTLLLESFGDDLELTLAELATRTGLPKSTVHRTAELMVQYGWLSLRDGTFGLGTRLFELGTRVREISRLREVAMPFMQSLCRDTKFVVNLGVIDGTTILYVEKLWAHEHLKSTAPTGHRSPVNWSAIGKSILAFSAPTVVDRVLAAGLPARTGRTITDPRVFREDLAGVAERGYALDNEEFAVGMRCCGVPIVSGGQAIAGISLSGPITQVEPAVVVPMLRRAAAGLTSLL